MNILNRNHSFKVYHFNLMKDLEKMHKEASYYTCTWDDDPKLIKLHQADKPSTKNNTIHIAWSYIISIKRARIFNLESDSEIECTAIAVYSYSVDDIFYVIESPNYVEDLIKQALIKCFEQSYFYKPKK